MGLVQLLSRCYRLLIWFLWVLLLTWAWNFFWLIIFHHLFLLRLSLELFQRFVILRCRLNWEQTVIIKFVMSNTFVWQNVFYSIELNTLRFSDVNSFDLLWQVAIWDLIIPFIRTIRQIERRLTDGHLIVIWSIFI